MNASVAPRQLVDERSNLKLLQLATRADRQAIELLLADDFVEIGSSGERFDREAVITGLLTESSENGSPARQIRNLGIAAVTDDVALVTYRVCRVDPDGTTTWRWRSSIWRLEDGEWRMVFHQGTPIPAPGIAPISA